ncbi:MAG: signal peptidase I [Nostocoides sp.]
MSTDETIAETPAPPAPSEQGAGSRRFAGLVLRIALVVVLAAIVRSVLLQSYYVPSGSMEPTVEPADRVLVDKLDGSSGLERGDIVVFDGTIAWGGPSTATHEDTGLVGSILTPARKALGIDFGEKDYLKRIIGLPGDHVVCCSASGHLRINGTDVTEPYLPSGASASAVTFDVTVPVGKVWLLGDNRPESADARAHLGDPGGGLVPLNDIIGRVTLRFWPIERWGTMERSTTLSTLRPGGRS